LHNLALVTGDDDDDDDDDEEEEEEMPLIDSELAGNSSSTKRASLDDCVSPKLSFCCFITTLEFVS